MSFTYDSSKVTKMEYGVFLRKKIATDVFMLPISALAYSWSKQAIMLDIPLSANILNNDTDTMSTKSLIYKIEPPDNTNIELAEANINIATPDNKDYVVLYNNQDDDYTGGIKFTDDHSYTYKLGANEGVVIVYNGSDWLVMDRTFTPIGFCKEQPKITAEKGDTVKSAYGVTLPISEDVMAEASNMEVTKANYEYLLGLQKSDVDFCLYAHSSKGISVDGMLISKNDGLQDGWLIKDVPIYSSLKITGNEVNLIDIMVDKSQGIGDAPVIHIADYTRD